MLAKKVNSVVLQRAYNRDSSLNQYVISLGISMTNSKETIKQNSQNKKTDKSTFIKETQQELAKVVWPSRQQLLSESVAVILMVILVASLIYLMDNIFSWSAGKVF